MQRIINYGIKKNWWSSGFEEDRAEASNVAPDKELHPYATNREDPIQNIKRYNPN